LTILVATVQDDLVMFSSAVYINSAIPNLIRTNLGDKWGTMCLLHRLAAGVWPSQLEQINADPKGNWYWVAWKKID